MVNLFAERFEVLRGGSRVANHQFVKDKVEHIGSHLLLGIAPRCIGITMRFDNQTIETEIHSLLRERSNEFAATAYVTGITKDGQIVNAAAQFYRYVPHGQVAVETLLVGRETAMDNAQAFQSGLVEAEQTAYPEFQIRINGIFTKDGDIHAFQTIGQLLHSEGIGHCARAYPKDVDAVF